MPRTGRIDPEPADARPVEGVEQAVSSSDRPGKQTAQGTIPFPLACECVAALPLPAALGPPGGRQDRGAVQGGLSVVEGVIRKAPVPGSGEEGESHPFSIGGNRRRPQSSREKGKGARADENPAGRPVTASRSFPTGAHALKKASIRELRAPREARIPDYRPSILSKDLCAPIPEDRRRNDRGSIHTGLPGSRIFENRLSGREPGRYPRIHTYRVLQFRQKSRAGLPFGFNLCILRIEKIV